jgi:hypothetical protein
MFYLLQCAPTRFFHRPLSFFTVHELSAPVNKLTKRVRTAEDLTATSRRLARYEALLNDIMPHVPPNVKAMIEEAREQVNFQPSTYQMSAIDHLQDAVASNSGGSETAEPNDMTRGYPPLPGEMSSNSSSRVSLPLPMPMPLGGQAPVGFPRPFESPVNAAIRPSSRASPEEQGGARLPSITAQGLLIEPSLAAQTGPMPQVTSDPALYTRAVGPSDSPNKPYEGQWDPQSLQSG